QDQNGTGDAARKIAQQLCVGGFKLWMSEFLANFPCFVRFGQWRGATRKGRNAGKPTVFSELRIQWPDVKPIERGRNQSRFECAAPFQRTRCDVFPCRVVHSRESDFLRLLDLAHDVSVHAVRRTTILGYAIEEVLVVGLGS